MGELEYTAYHESGHAVIAAMLGGVVSQVTIIPPDNGASGTANRCGDTRIEWPMAGVSPKEHAIREIKTALAGPAAEAIYRDEYDSPPINQEAAADWLAASQYAGTIIENPNRRVSLLHEVASQLMELFRGDERIWSAVAAVADELLSHETIGHEEVESVVGFWMS